MVAKCANPQCNSEFRELSKGRLFLLPPISQFRDSFANQPRLIDHCYWLCPHCTVTHTISISGTTVVISQIVEQNEPCSDAC